MHKRTVLVAVALALFTGPVAATHPVNSSQLNSPFVSGNFVQSSQNVQETDLNRLRDIYYRVMTLHDIDPSLSMLNETEKQEIINHTKVMQASVGGFGDWDGDRAKAGSTRMALEVLDVFGAQPANRTKLVSWMRRLQVTNVTYGRHGFRSYLQDSDADISATYNIIRSFELLGEPAPNKQDVVAYAKQHQNPDGGFGLQTVRDADVFWPSTAVHTYRGLRTLDILEAEPDFKTESVDFLNGLQQSNGGFTNTQTGSRGRTAYTYDVVLALKILGEPVPRRDDVISFLRNNQVANGGYTENAVDSTEAMHSTFWAVTTLDSLGVDVSDSTARQYVQTSDRRENNGGFGNVPGMASGIRFTFDVVHALNLIGEEPLNRTAAAQFLRRHRKPDGGFGPGSLNHSTTEDTYRATYALQLLDASIQNRQDAIDFLRSAQNDDGGFGWAPGSTSRGSYTFRAVKALHLLGADPKDVDGVIDYLKSLQNADGGFGNFPADDSDVTATYRSVDALDFLGAKPEDVQGAIQFIRQSKNPDGGFRRSPSDVTTPKNLSNSIYTYSAVRTLSTLEALPHNRSDIYGFLAGLRNPDLGYAQQPFFTSKAATTFTSLYAYFTLFPDIFNLSPQLNVYRSPQTGNTSTQFTFRINYTDREDQLPQRIHLILNGDQHPLQPVDETDQNAMNGKMYRYRSTVPAGENQYSVVADDGLKETRRGPFTFFANYTGNAPRVNISVLPRRGNKNTNFTFEAVYRDADGDPPAYVKVKIDDVWYDMTKAEETTNFHQGARYTYTTRLPDGDHRFRVKASDGENTVLTLKRKQPTVLDKRVIRPDQETFQRIETLLQEAKNVAVDRQNVSLAVFKGQYAWNVRLDGDEVHVSKDGTRILTRQDRGTVMDIRSNPVFQAVISGAVVLFILFVLLWRR